MRSVLALAFLAAACGAPETEHTAPATAAPIVVSDAWASPTPNGVDVSAGFLTIVGAEEDTLLSATSPRAERMEIHSMVMEGAVMQMRAMPSLPVSAGETITLAPGGAHLMFIGVTQPFAIGEEIPVQLTFEHAGQIDVTLQVRAPGVGGHGH